MTYSVAFEKALDHAMLYEVGGFWQLTPQVEAGLITTTAQRKSVGYTDDPHDRGGETKFGIAKNANPTVDVAALTYQQAKDVYFKNYWIPAKCDKMPGRLAVLQFDGAVNHGPKTASKFIQQSLSLLDDGIVGPMTINSIFMINEIVLCNLVCDKRVKFYNAIVAADSGQSRFLNGWLRRVAEMRAFVTDPTRSFN